MTIQHNREKDRERVTTGTYRTRAMHLTRTLTDVTHNLTDLLAEQELRTATLEAEIAYVGEITTAYRAALSSIAPTYLDAITEEDIRHTLHHYGDRVNGWEPGKFTATLIHAITRADTINRSRLESAYPGLVRAVNLIQREVNGRATLEALLIDLTE